MILAVTLLLIFSIDIGYYSHYHCYKHVIIVLICQKLIEDAA